MDQIIASAGVGLLHVIARIAARGQHLADGSHSSDCRSSQDRVVRGWKATRVSWPALPSYVYTYGLSGSDWVVAGARQKGESEVCAMLAAQL